MTTRRHRKSEERYEEELSQLVSSCVAEFREHADEAEHFLVVCSVHAELAKERDPKDTFFDEHQSVEQEINDLIRKKEWKQLLEFVASLDDRFNVFMVNSLNDLEAKFRELWGRLSGFGVRIATSEGIWLEEPKICYAHYWVD